MNQFEVYICKPIPKSSKRGLDQQRFYMKNLETGVKTNLNKVRTKGLDHKGNSLPEPIIPLKNKEGTAYDIGLSQLLDNPFKDRKPSELISSYNLDASWKDYLVDIVSSDEITKQTWAEIRFGLPYNELTQNVPPKGTKENPDTRTRVMKIKVVLYDEVNPFCTDNLNGFLAIQTLLNDRSGRVAPSQEAVNTATHGWVIVKQAVEQRLEIAATQKQNKAIGRLANYMEKYPATNALEENIMYFIGSGLLDNKYNPLFKDKVTPAVISEKIDAYLKPKKELVSFHVDRFNKHLDLFENQPELFYAKYLGQQCKNKNIIQQVNSKWFWKRANGTTDEFESLDAFSNYIYSESEKIESSAFSELITRLQSRGCIVPLFFTQEVESRSKED